MADCKGKKIEMTAMRPRAVLLCGLSGSGKTSYARRMEELGAVRLSVDEEIFRLYGCEFTKMPGEERRRLTLQVEESLRVRMTELLGAGRDVVVDSCMCKRFKREAFESAALQADADVVKIYLTADRATLEERLSHRRGEGADDMMVSPEELGRFMRNFQKPEPDERFETLCTGEECMKDRE